MTPAMYTTAEVCAILVTTRTTVRAMVLAGVLESPLRGRISRRSVAAVLEDGRAWQEIAREKHAASEAAVRNGRKRQPATGDGKSAKTATVTPFPTLTASGRQKNLLD